MNWAEMVVVIVLIGAIASVINNFFRVRPAAEVRTDPDPGARIAQEEVRQLKERIQVLERVITDNHGSRRLDDEIERLRDR